jgi:hypothetical protein
LENDDSVSVLVVEPTVITVGAPAGDSVQASIGTPAKSPFPAAATTVKPAATRLLAAVRTDARLP